MKKFFLFIALCLSVVAFAITETVEIEGGGTWHATAGRLAAVRILANSPSAAFTMQGVESWAVYTNYTETITEQVPMWRRVITNATESVTNDYPGQVVFTPPPPWHLASEGWITNTVTTSRTRRVKTGSFLASTNTLASGTCSAGAYTNTPSGLWLSDGEAVTFAISTAGATGRALLIIER